MKHERYHDVCWLFAAVTRGLLRTGGEGAAEVVAGIAAQDLGEDQFRDVEPRRLPVLSHLAPCVAEVMMVDADLAAALAALADDLAWRQSEAYSDSLLGEGFMDGYGWCQFIGPYGFFPGDDFLLGLLMLGPNRHYRDHFHPAPELYWPLAGRAFWKRGNGPLLRREPGESIWHSPGEIHATRTGDTPLLALWCWTRDTATPASLVAPDQA